MSVRLAAVASAFVIAAATLAGCGSDSTDDPGSEERPTDDASQAAPECPEGARCFDFTEDSEGWPEISDDEHFAGRDAYLDGTYRVGARQPGSWTMTAPVQVSALADDYGVQVDTDATLGQAFPPEAAWGITCWTRKTRQGQIAGFAVYVQLNAVTIGLYDEDTGDFEPLKELEAEGLTTPGEKTHLMLRCRAGCLLGRGRGEDRGRGRRRRDPVDEHRRQRHPARLGTSRRARRARRRQGRRRLLRPRRGRRSLTRHEGWPDPSARGRVR